MSKLVMRGPRRLASLLFFGSLARNPCSVLGLSPAPTLPEAAPLGLAGTKQRGACQRAGTGVVGDRCSQVTLGN